MPTYPWRGDVVRRAFRNGIFFTRQNMRYYYGKDFEYFLGVVFEKHDRLSVFLNEKTANRECLIYFSQVKAKGEEIGTLVL